VDHAAGEVEVLERCQLLLHAVEMG
jgi:hypothetical protein